MLSRELQRGKKSNLVISFCSSSSFEYFVRGNASVGRYWQRQKQGNSLGDLTTSFDCVASLTLLNTTTATTQSTDRLSETRGVPAEHPQPRDYIALDVHFG